MGIGKTDLALLIRLKEQGALPDVHAVVEIGAHQLTNSFVGAAVDVERLGRLFGSSSSFALASPLVPVIGSDGIEQLSPAAPSARSFWTWLGLEYAAIDVDGSPDSIALDLNYDEVPAELKGRFGVATNFGTT